MHREDVCKKWAWHKVAKLNCFFAPTYAFVESLLHGCLCDDLSGPVSPSFSNVVLPFAEFGLLHANGRTLSSIQRPKLEHQLSTKTSAVHKAIEKLSFTFASDLTWHLVTLDSALVLDDQSWIDATLRIDMFACSSTCG